MRLRTESFPLSECGVKHTEASMLALLANRYGKSSGNGPEWAFIPKVRNAAGFNATRTMDRMYRGGGHE